MQGKIIKGVGGFYYVHLHDDSNTIYECKAKGAFRNQKIKPSVGDNVDIDIVDEDALIGNITAVHKRSNSLVRPVVTNVDQAVIIFALANPAPNFNLVDRFLMMMANQSVETILCLNKADIGDETIANEAKSAYEAAGYKVVICSTYDKSGVDELKKLIENKTTVLAGPSGVGKSSIINCLKPDAMAETGEISQKIKRGKHTTRHSELMFVDKDTYIMDTPGFSSLYIEEMEAKDVKDYYEEFVKYNGLCKFNGCTHIHEPGCAVKEALEMGQVSKLRYDNYVLIYDEVKNRRKW